MKGKVCPKCVARGVLDSKRFLINKKGTKLLLRPHKVLLLLLLLQLPGDVLASAGFNSHLRMACTCAAVHHLLWAHNFERGRPDEEPGLGAGTGATPHPR